MTPPAPRRHNPQTQPLTTALRKICNDYRAGSGVLRELLQNADDAGASQIEFILDTKSHPTSSLLVDGLEEYQGPALLAYNDAVFQDTDWKSLSSIGDSEKKQDKIATGKYGLGFNSVYNWTDCPSIVSDTTLLLLDPHHSWSSKFPSPGGPAYGFTDDPDDQAMKDQLHAFSLVNSSWRKPFGGTIIRIPLRNAMQARKSKIRSKETTAAEIQNSMNAFADEMGTFGLLFLKSVRRIVFKVDNVCRNIVEISSDSDLTKPKLCLEKLVMGKISSTLEIYHEVTVKREAIEVVSNERYGVCHLLGHQSHDQNVQELMDWAEGEKLLPWTAIAARLDDQNGTAEAGKLFSVLPLSDPTDLKVQIHGLFSLSADRSRPHGREDRTMEDPRPARWNQFLFSSMIPNAWATLYSHMCCNHPHSNFQFYERGSQSKIHLWHNISSDILDVVCRKNLKVWKSFSTYTNAEQAIFTTYEPNSHLVQAMKAINVLAVFVEGDMLPLAKTKLSHRFLSPRLLFDSVKLIEKWPSLSQEANSALLEYLFPSISAKELGHLPIFPFEDGVYRALSAKAFLHRDSFEKEFFKKGKAVNLDISKISETVHTALHDCARENTKVGYRSAKDVRDYCLQYIVNGDADVISTDEDIDVFIRKTWIWIDSYSTDISELSELKSLWLLPLEAGKVRKLVPQTRRLVATFFNGGGPYDVARSFIAHDAKVAERIISNRLFDDTVKRWLISFTAESCFNLKDGNEFGGFALFLKESVQLLSTLPDDKLGDCHRVLKETYLSKSRTAKEKEALKSIPIYPEVQWNKKDGNHASRQLVSLSVPKTFYGLKALIALPLVKRQGIIDATNQETLNLLVKAELAICLDESAIVEKLVIPATKAGLYNEMASDYRLNASEAIFQNFYRLSSVAQALIPKLCIVPQASTVSDKFIRFSPCESMIDPRSRSSNMKDLFFENEVFWPDSKFLARYSAILTECGLMEALNESLASQRIKAYAEAACDLSIVEPRVRTLLSTKIAGRRSPNGNFVKLARSLRWLPARKLDGMLALCSVDECRDLRSITFAGYVMPIMPFNADQSWDDVLTWPELSSDLLISQLQTSITHQEWSSINATLTKLSERNDVLQHVDSLRSLNFIRSSEGAFIKPLNACRRDAEKLSPYISNVDGGFWKTHAKLLKLLKVPESPDLSRLIAVQSAFMDLTQLETEQIDIAVAVAILWSSNSFELSGLRLPDTTGTLQPLRELIFGDVPYQTDSQRPLAHSKVSPSLAKILGIEPISVLIEKQQLSILDEEDEFDQFEDVTHGIKDTLSRYSVESTFHEFIANADDCGSATQLNLMFDGNTYEQDNLLTPEMKNWQGPALILHNDGVFTEKDFDGFKHVGRGSKRDNPETIGKFGRGSQTIYHWTDVPMILSGDFLLILDPLRKHLPYNHRRQQRKPGVKISIEKLRLHHPSHLVPFEGLWGFKSTQNRYEGTIFRLPLRNMSESSDLLEFSDNRDASFTKSECDKFFSEAQISLLFIRNIKLVDYSLRSNKAEKALPVELQWRAMRGKWPEEDSFSDWADIQICQYDSSYKMTESTERYWRCIEDISQSPMVLKHRHKRTMKNIECGVAALVPFQPQSGHRFFNCLPLKFISSLPLHVHATFLLSGDRQNIPTEITAEESGSSWNVWLLNDAIPKVYLQFLEDLGRKIGTTIYDYFPNTQLNDHLSQTVSDAFWATVSSSTNRIFPVVEAELEPGTIMNVNKRATPRKAHSLVEARKAVFDLLSEKESRTLQPLLSRHQAFFVQPTRGLVQILKTLKDLNIVTATTVRNLLKTDEASKIVEDIRTENDARFFTILKFITPSNGDELAELDQCKILPLADGTLARIFLNSEPGLTLPPPTYFWATDEVLTLFSFAASRLAACKDQPLMQKVFNSGKFNLKAFDATMDTSHLLQLKKDWNMNVENKQWIVEFWRYNTRFSFSWLGEFPLHVLEDVNGIESFESLESFECGPAVVRPDAEQHQTLLMAIPGMRMADPKTLPALFQVEKTLCHPNSMERLVNSMEMLADQRAQSLIDFALSCLDDGQLKILNALLQDLINQRHLLSELCYELPVCVSYATGKAGLSPAMALSAENFGLVQPFMKDYQLFTRNKDFLPKTSILSTPFLLENYILQWLPQTLKEKAEKEAFILFLHAIWSEKAPRSNKKEVVMVPLEHHALAPRQDGSMCLASTLYDQSVSMFAAAFADKAATAFLIPEAQIPSLKPLWKSLGLKSDRSLQMQDYLACLAELQSLTKHSDDSMLSRIKNVLVPLHSPTGGALLNADDASKQRLSELALFPVTDKGILDEPQFRRKQMRLLASHRFQPLKDTVLREYIAICWSQVSFVDPEPTVSALQTYRGTSMPLKTTVWNHLKFLAECVSEVIECDKEAFLSDLDKTYENLLQSCLPHSTNGNEFLKDAIWLNIDDRNAVTLEDLKSSWMTLDHLILESPCDAPPLRTVGTYLAKFSPLLEASGCKKIFYPAIQALESQSSRALLPTFLTFRENNVLVDVTFEAKDSSDTSESLGCEYRAISAHKLVLAVNSEYCKTQFHSTWAAQAGTSNMVRLEEIRFEALWVMIDFCYNCHEPWFKNIRVNGSESNDELADRLDSLIGVLAGAEMWIMPQLHILVQNEIMAASRFLIRPDNVKRVREEMESARASRIVDYCKEFEASNSKAIELATKL